MNISEARYKANKKYDRKTYKQVVVRVRRDEKDVLDWLESKKSKSGYILELIKEDMNKK